MEPTGEEQWSAYERAIGRITIRAAQVEDMVLMTLIALQEHGVDARQYHVERMFMGAQKNIDALGERLAELLTPQELAEWQSVLETAKRLYRLRNEHVHGTWMEQRTIDGEFVRVSRNRYRAQRRSAEPQWDVSTPSLEDLDSLNSEFRAIVRQLECLHDRLWRISEMVDWQIEQSNMRRQQAQEDKGQPGSA